MKHLMKYAVAALALILGANAAAKGNLVLYHWFEYMPQEVLDKFAEETGIEVAMDTYDSNESMLASLHLGIPQCSTDRELL